jgi:hypothetical protein
VLLIRSIFRCLRELELCNPPGKKGLFKAEITDHGSRRIFHFARLSSSPYATGKIPLEMGQGPSVGYIRDLVNSEAYRADCAYAERVSGLAFDKCIDKAKVGNEHLPSKEESACVDEYTLLFTASLRNGVGQFNQLYEQYQREMYEKARVDQLNAQRVRTEP